MGYHPIQFVLLLSSFFHSMSRTDSASAPWGLLLVVAAGLLLHCSVLVVEYRAVPTEQLYKTSFAVAYLLLVSRSISIPHTVAVRGNVQPLTSRSVLQRFILRFLLSIGLTVSLIIPWCLVYYGDYSTVVILAPHMFMYAVQLLMEIWSYRASFSIGLRLLITIGLIGYRLWMIFDWIMDAKELFALRILAFVNLTYWGLIFQFLLVFVAPKYFPGRAPPAKYVSR